MYMGVETMVISDDGTRRWYRDGRLHRVDGAAIEWATGYGDWYYDGVRHRADGPAIETATYSGWFLNGVRHRVDGPAIIEKVSSYHVWYFDGKKHRDDGPAIEFSDGSRRWYYHGREYSEVEYNMVTFFGVEIC